MRETLSRNPTGQKIVFAALASGFFFGACLFIRLNLIVGVVMLTVSLVIGFIWRKIVRKYSTVVYKDGKIIIGNGEQDVTLDSGDIVSIELIPYMRTSAYRLIAKTDKERASERIFLFVAASGVTEEVIRKRCGSQTKGVAW